MKKLLLSLLLASNLYPCTGISIKSNDNNFIQARSIEYGEGDLQSKLIISPRNFTFQSMLPNTNELGLKWVSKYGFVGISVIDSRFIAEGVNEAGLNAGFFYFPHYGSLDRYNKIYQKNSIIDMQLITYILSSFKNVDEVKQGLNKIKIVNIAYDKNNNPYPTAHYRISDADGKNVVLEITDNGKINFYDNTVGVITNSPDFPWHLKNLNNYVNLKAGNANNNNNLISFGVGTAALGLPGDITPPSRFVRAYYYLSTLKDTNTYESVMSAFHILNNFDIPIGLEYASEYKNHIPKELLSATQWTSASDLKNKEFYYKTMKNQQIRKIDLKKIDFNKSNYFIKELDLEDGIKELKF